MKRCLTLVMCVAIWFLHGCRQSDDKAREQLFDQIKNGNMREARLAEERLRKFGPSIVPDLIPLLTLEKGHARYCAKDLLIYFGPDALDSMQASIESASPALRVEIATVLKWILREKPTRPTDPRIISMLRRFAKEEDINLRLAVTGALFECSADEIVQELPFVVAVRQSTNPLAAISGAATELKAVDSEQAVLLLAKYMKSEETGLRYAAQGMLRKLKERARPLIPHLVLLLDDKNYPERVEVVYLLSAFAKTHPIASEAIEKARSDDDQRVRDAVSK
jgi:HEAT repeat protein